MDISFIIPAYNAETVIRHSISSIKEWDFEEKVEIIIINDGSTDNTEKVCQEIAADDSTISVFSIDNSGQGIARNVGLLHAKGDYICFVDADDEIIPENVHKMWLKAKEDKLNLVMASYVRKCGSLVQYPLLPSVEGVFARSHNKKSLYHKIKTESVFGYVWNKLYEREFLIKHNLVMDDIKKVYMEDLLFNVKVWSHSPKTYYMGIPVYAYHVDNASTTRNQDAEIHEKNVVMIETMTKYLEAENVLEENLDMVIPIIMRMYCWSLVKNIPYEGNSIKKIKYRSRHFCQSEAVRKCIGQKHVIKSLFYLPSKLQSVFYTFCCIGLKLKCNTLIAVVFFVSYPLLKSYIAATVK